MTHLDRKGKVTGTAIARARLRGARMWEIGKYLVSRHLVPQ
jgi:hypothetical protein